MRREEVSDLLTKHMLLARMGVILRSVDEISYPAISQQYGGLPAGGSPMARDIESLSVEAVANVGRTCGVWHAVAAEALQATAAALSDGLILFAPGPLHRFVVEHSARIGWVLDGNSSQNRAARAWLADVVANGDDVQTHRNAGNTSQALAGAPERLEALCEESLPNLFGGQRPDRTKRSPSQWTFLGDRWGTSTDVVEAFFDKHVQPRWGEGLDGRVEYRITSMFTHPSITAAFVQSAEQDDPGSTTFVWDWPHVRIRTLVALVAFESATCSLYSYLGWTPDALLAWTDHLRQFIADTAGPR